MNRCFSWSWLAPGLVVLFGSVAAVGYGPTALAEEKEEAAELDAEKGHEFSAERDDEYYELLQLFVDTLDQVERNYVKDISRRELMEAAIEGMLSKLDQYSNYIGPEEVDRFRTEVESEFGGIGIQISMDGGRLTVVSPLVGTPAYRAGVKPGDQILKIEGEETRDISIDEAVQKLKGKVGTSVEITVRHVHDDKTETVKLEREVIRVETVLGDHRGENDGWEYMYDAEKKIGYIRITTFSRHTVEELQEAMRQLKEKGLEGLILDLRFNPGGLLSAAIEVSDMFLTDGVIVSTEGRNIAKRTWTAKPRDTYSGFPMAVLVNRYSASASEIVSAALQDHERAIVVGERTWGKASVQNIVELEEGRSALKLTTAGYSRPSGENIHKFDGATDEDKWGVIPSSGFEVKLDGAELGQLLNYQRNRILLKRETEEEQPDPTYVDRQFQKAIDFINEKLASKASGEKSEEKAAQADEQPAPAAG